MEVEAVMGEIMGPNGREVMNSDGTKGQAFISRLTLAFAL